MINKMTINRFDAIWKLEGARCFVWHQDIDAKQGDIVYFYTPSQHKIVRSFRIERTDFLPANKYRKQKLMLLSFYRIYSNDILCDADLHKHGVNEINTSFKAQYDLNKYLQNVDKKADNFYIPIYFSDKTETDESSSFHNNQVLIEKNAPKRSANVIKNGQNDFCALTIDFEKESSKKSKVGKAGEERVVTYEKQRLINSGRADLAAKVITTRESIGNTAKFDIQSYNDDGSERFIEVKTTTGPITTKFSISESEIQFSETHSNNYYIYRLYNFNEKEKSTEFYILKGKIDRSLLKATQYIY